jgi:hypothetical protein
MSPSSRTPEGQPHRCEVCGNEIKIEASFPPGDAPCPCCNSLVWFEPMNEPRPKPTDIEVTKRQKQELVSQIESLSKADLEGTEFYEQFLALTVRALAAVGGAVWQVRARRSWLPWSRASRSLRLMCQLNLPKGLYDASTEAAAHRRLLQSVLGSPSEQLIAPRVEATDWQWGANPTNQLLLIQPLGNPPEVRGILEIFCRPAERIPTQRGYQKFVKMMCQFEEKYHEQTHVAKALGVESS